MTAAKKDATNTTKPETPAGPPAGGSPPAGTEGGGSEKKVKGKYSANWPVRANKQDFAAGDDVTGLSEKQATELLALGAIEPK